MSMLVGVCASLLLAALALRDLAVRRLPNPLVFAYAVLFIPWAFFSGLGAIGLLLHLAVAAVAFVLLCVLFAAGIAGGGDVKLGAAVFAWAGVSHGLAVLAVVTWSGALLGVLGWIMMQPFAAARVPGPLVRALSARRGVPYGVALAVGGLYSIWQ